MSEAEIAELEHQMAKIRTEVLQTKLINRGSEADAERIEKIESFRQVLTDYFENRQIESVTLRRAIDLLDAREKLEALDMAFNGLTESNSDLTTAFSEIKQKINEIKDGFNEIKKIAIDEAKENAKTRTKQDEAATLLIVYLKKWG